jgi:hypothetical protein
MKPRLVDRLVRISKAKCLTLILVALVLNAQQCDENDAPLRETPLRYGPRPTEVTSVSGRAASSWPAWEIERGLP